MAGEPGETSRDDSVSSVTALTLSAALRISHPQTPHQPTPTTTAPTGPPFNALDTLLVIQRGFVLRGPDGQSPATKKVQVPSSVMPVR